MSVKLRLPQNCYDNAPMESFWGTLKNESLSHYRFNNRDEAISVIREYIEYFLLIVSVVTLVLGNISPAAFREKYHQMAVLKKRTNGSVRYCQYTSAPTAETPVHNQPVLDILPGCERSARYRG
ncbi:IS3 family transposase [Shigella dysenteriae]|uniref:IS3 family transposase n=1 Tax=Shigella dysenteriae TaxID=622 RepID=UPI003EB7436E